MAPRGRLRRLSFSARFALLLALLGAFVAAAVVFIPLSQGAADSRQSALDRVADESGLVLSLLSAEERSLTSFAETGSRQVGATDAGTPARAALLVQLSGATAGGDIVGVVGPGPSQTASGGALLASSSNDWLRSAAPNATPVVADPMGHPWLIGTASVPRQAVVTYAFVARRMTDSALARLSSGSGGAPPAGIAVVRDGHYAINATMNGAAIPAGATFDPAFLPVVEQAGGPSQVVHTSGGDIAAAATDIGGGYTLVVLAAVPDSHILRDVVPVFVVTAALVLAGLVLVYALVQLDLRRPLRRLDRAVGALSRGDFDMPVATGGDSALTHLGESFISVRAELQSLLRLAEARAAIATELSAPASLDAALRMVCERLRAACGAALAVVAVSGQEGRPGAVYPAGTPLIRDADAILDGDGVIGFVSREPSTGAVFACPVAGTVEAELGLHEVCAAPLRIGSTHLGAVAVADVDPAFSTHVRELLDAAAEQVALALERERVLVMARMQASTDSLTGLSNRRFLTDFLEQQVAIADRSGTTFSVVMLDVDHFKSINDTHGHEVGDEALRQVARTLGGTLRRSDLAARLGGDEFLVVMSDTKLDAAAGVAEKLRCAIATVRLHTDATRRRARVTVSVGVASRLPGGPGVDRLLTLVDDALYQAKHEGRDRVVVSYSDEERIAAPGPPSRRGRSARGGGT